MKTAMTAGVLGSLLWTIACGGGDQTGERDRATMGTPVVTLPAGSGSSAGAGGSSVGAAGRSSAVAGAIATQPPPPPPAGAPAPIGVAGRPGTGAAGAPGMMTGVAGAPPPAAGAGAPPPATGDRSPEGVCSRWKVDRADISEGTWSGDVASCNNGDISANGRANALKLVNLYRWLADLPPVTSDPTMDKQAQACALMQRANNMLSHTPPSTWTCYNMEGATAAGRCNISTGPGVASVDGYMVDPGNPTTIGHRRWILSNTFGPTGLGSTDKHSCMMTFGKMKVGKAWQAWPAPGSIPLQAMQGGFGQKVDSTGWTVQSDTINLANAQVSVMADGMAMPVTVTQLGAGYGSKYALRFNPMGWSTTAGKTYSVSVTGGAMPISYMVQIVDCK
ncbi:MAG TPA: CAP domain-containing protein [Polyangiales bacterium]|nr:CAP domain-containing protein [Polyangiales bacterium]